MAPPGRRAAPLPPAERRAAIIAVTIPLLTAQGAEVTTKQIAAAAGIAEGTLFRVFPDKAALVQAAVQSAFDPSDLLATLGDIDPGLPLQDRLRITIDALVARLERVWSLMHMLRMTSPPDTNHARHAPGEHAGGRPGLPHTDMARTMTAIEQVIGSDADQLRFPVDVAARMLRTITFAGGHPAMNEGTPLSTEDMVGMLLDGIRARPAAGAATASTAVPPDGSPPTPPPNGGPPPAPPAPPAREAPPASEPADLETAAC